MAVHRFAVDRMLGRLASWLRIIGQDATYGPHLGGAPLLRHARAEGRILLTRSSHLLRREDVPPSLFIRSNAFREQLQQVIAAFALDPYAECCSRCTRCNMPLAAMDRSAAAGAVPAYVHATQHHFLRCPQCGRIYWPATHRQRILAELGQMGFKPNDMPPTSVR